MHYNYRPSFTYWLNVCDHDNFVMKRLFHIQDPYWKWIHADGMLREQTCKPFISKYELKEGFYFAEFVH